MKFKGFDIQGLDLEGRTPAEQASIMAEVERAIETIKACGPDATSEDLMAAYEHLRPEYFDGELVYTLPEDVA